MKTKLTLFVAVIAVALFGMGCGSVPKPDATNAVKWNGHWYAVFTDEVSWGEAKMKCEEKGGQLVIIGSEEENEFLFNLASDSNPNARYAWIGVSDRVKKGELKWVDGSLVKDGFSKWTRDDIVQYTQRWDYGTLILRGEHPSQTDKKWDLGDGTQEWIYICEWE